MRSRSRSRSESRVLAGKVEIRNTFISNFGVKKSREKYYALFNDCADTVADVHSDPIKSQCRRQRVIDPDAVSSVG